MRIRKKNTRTIQTVRNQRKTTESEIFWSISICSSIFSDFILSYQFLFSSLLNHLLLPPLFSSSLFISHLISLLYSSFPLLISSSSLLFLFSSLLYLSLISPHLYAHQTNIMRELREIEVSMTRSTQNHGKQSTISQTMTCQTRRTWQTKQIRKNWKMNL